MYTTRLSIAKELTRSKLVTYNIFLGVLHVAVLLPLCISLCSSWPAWLHDHVEQLSDCAALSLPACMTSRQSYRLKVLEMISVSSRTVLNITCRIVPSFKESNFFSRTFGKWSTTCILIAVALCVINSLRLLWLMCWVFPGTCAEQILIGCLRCQKHQKLTNEWCKFGPVPFDAFSIYASHTIHAAWRIFPLRKYCESYSSKRPSPESYKCPTMQEDSCA